ncbi:MAG: LptE family protein [Rikenellaceae bacterium]
MNKILKITAFVVLLVGLVSCGVKYSFTGASIAPEVKTYSVADFPNVAPMVSPILSSTFTAALMDKMARSTSLSQVSSNQVGDMCFEGEIVDYTSMPIAVTGDEYATKNRLTVTVRVKFVNRFQPKNNFDKRFSAYEDYDNNLMLQSVEPTLIPQIVDKLVTDIFNAAASNW